MKNRKTGSKKKEEAKRKKREEKEWSFGISLKKEKKENLSLELVFKQRRENGKQKLKNN